MRSATVTVHIARDRKVIECEARTINDAGWLVHYFNKEHRSLVDKGWLFTCHEVGSRDIGTEERHHITGSWCKGAGQIAHLIENPPKPPAPNHCITCTCPPESECCK